MKYNAYTQKGFTLVEFLVYIGMMGIILTAVAGLIAVIIQTSAKNATITEVEENGAFINEYIARVVRNADKILQPVANSSASAMTVDVFAASEDPTIFDVSLGGALRVKKGAAAAVPLSSGAVVVSVLSFQNASRSGSLGSVRYQFTVSHINPGNRNEYSFTKTFYGAASTR